MARTDNNAAAEDMQDPVNTAAAEAAQTDPQAEQLQQKEAELGEMKDKYLRLAAEFDNFRRRTAQERLEERQTAGRDLMTSLLDVLDDCDRAEKVLAGDQDPETMKEGVRLVFQKLRSLLEGRGLKQMEVLEQDFDVDLHEAIAEVPAPTEALKGKVMDQVQKGYKLNDKIIRFAKVVVGK